MSKSKSKSSKDIAKSQSDVLTKVKDAAVVKPAQTLKSKAKDLAQAVAGKEQKKSKQKKVKEPTPEPSDVESEESASESEGSESSADSDSDSESEAKVQKSAGNGKPAGVKVNGDADSSDESESSESSADDTKAKKTNGAKVPAAKADSDDESDEASDSDDSEEDNEEEQPKAAAGAAEKMTAAAASSDEDSDADSDASDDNEEVKDDSDDADESEEEAKPKQVATKRKAEDLAVPAVKKTKTETNDAIPASGNLFVGNLSWNVDEDWLTREFETFGELQGVRIITDRESGRSKGFGYVEFVNAADAAKAHAAKAGSELDGRNINVDFAQKREQGAKPQDRANDRRKSYGDSTSEPSDTLFCGNLSFDADQNTVAEAFSEHGTVLGVRLPTDRETGNPKGFGYVTFASVEEAGAAMEAMNGAEIAGRSVRLDYSQPRPQNGDSPARGRGGFGGGRGGSRGGGRGFGDRGGRGGGRGRGGFSDRGGRGGGRGASTNRGGFGDFSGKKTTF